MAISLVTLVDTFLTWMTKTNDLITIANLSTEGQLNTSGTLKITNSGMLSGGVSLNVSSGMIKGDGGLLTNVTTFSANTSIANHKLINPYIRLVSNSTTLVVNGGNTANLGSTVYFDVGALSNNTSDSSSANIASANSVYTVNQLAVSAVNAASFARTTANTAQTTANAAQAAAFSVQATANTAQTTANAAQAAANAAKTAANNAHTAANNAHTEAYNAQATADDALTTADAAFSKANTTAAYFDVSKLTIATVNTSTTTTPLTLTTGNTAVGITINPANSTVSITATNLLHNGKALGAGKQTMWLPASALTTRFAFGPKLTQFVASNDINYTTLNFDAVNNEIAETSIRMPKSWNKGTITFTPVMSQLTTSAGTVVWTLSGAAISSGDSIAANLGAEISTNVTGGTANIAYMGAESANVTIGGSPVDGDLILFKIQRAATSNSDTLAIDARLHGINIYYTANTGSDA